MEAWTEPAEFERDEEFRTALRDFFHRAFGIAQGRLMTSPETAARVERHRKLLLEAPAVQQTGVPADAPQARDRAEQLAADSAELVAAMTGKPDRTRTGRRQSGSGGPPPCVRARVERDRSAGAYN